MRRYKNRSPPVEYDEYDDPLFIRIFFGWPPLYPKIIEMSPPHPPPPKQKKKTKKVNYRTVVIIVSVLLKKVSVL